MDFISDVPKYRKRSKKKAGAKSDHKHAYTWCVFAYHDIELDPGHGFVQSNGLRFAIGSYCPICGKIGSHTTTDPRWYKNIGYWPGMDKWRTVYTEEALREFDEKTRTLPCFRLEDRWSQKYVEVPEG